MKNQHTPGPWKCQNEDGKWLGNHDDWSASYDGDNSTGVETTLPIVAGDGTTVAIAVYQNTSFDDDEELEANARLIAAAPDLLEALVQLNADARYARGGDEKALAAHERARAAIAKATGLAA